MPDGDKRRQNGAGRIVTFYSFKGGTGRTMALANVAWILAASGKRVLVADWDLESPGLHEFFWPFMQPGATSQPGIVDFIRRYEWAAKEEAARLAECGADGRKLSEQVARAAMTRLIDEHVAEADRYTVPVTWNFPDDGAIDFLTPGKQGNGVYEYTLSALDWDTLYDNLGGAEFFDALRDHWKSVYDYILIDSRIGLSDIADICTLHLPDVVIDCFTLSTQGIEGAARMARQIQLHSEREIAILPVPMRVDHAQQANVIAGLRLARSQFLGLPAGLPERLREQYWAQVQVPYQPAYAYEEMLAAFRDRPDAADSLLGAYERIVAWITGHEVTAMPPLDERRRLRTRQQIARTALPPVPPAVVIDFSPRDQGWAEWIAAVLARIGIDARLAGEAPVTASSESSAPVIAVVSEFYIRRPDTQHFPFGRPDLVVCVTGTRLPPRLPSGTSAIFLAGLSEIQAMQQVADRFEGRRPAGDQPANGTRSFPGADQGQLASMPARNADFTGRDATLAEMRAQLNASPATAARVLVIRGPRGTGKTELALEYAHRFAADYDVIWWMTGRHPQSVKSSLGHLGTRLRDAFAADLPGPGGEEAARVLEFLGSQTPKRWLLVYDDVAAEDFAAVRPLLPRGGGHVLITTPGDLPVSPGQTLVLGAFERAESVTHLRTQRPDISEPAAYRLAAVLADMPHAVARAGAVLASGRMTVPGYLRLLEE